MRFETVKTIILIILVLASMVLTAYVWTFQPDTYRESSIEGGDAATLGGAEKTIADVITPTHMYVHANPNHFVFSSYEEEQNLLSEMRDWTLTDVKQTTRAELSDSQQLELVYPVGIPYAQLGILFQVEDERMLDRLGTKVFTRVYVIPEDDGAAIVFLNENEEEPLANAVTAKVSENISEIFYDESNLTAAKEVNSDVSVWNSIYIPNSTAVSESYVRSETISKTAFLDTYLSSDHQKLQGQDIYRDSNGTSSVEFQYNGALASYEDQLTRSSGSSPQATTRSDQLRTIVSTTNTSMGWTDDYQLSSISGDNSHTYQFRMLRNGYPIYNEQGLSEVEIRMQGSSLLSIERTLLNFGAIGTEGSVSMLRASEVTKWIASSEYTVNDIQDVTVGYNLQQNTDTAAVYRYHLVPSWYIKVQNEWIQVTDTSQSEEEGN